MGTNQQNTKLIRILVFDCKIPLRLTVQSPGSWGYIECGVSAHTNRFMKSRNERYESDLTSRLKFVCWRYLLLNISLAVHGV